MSDTETKRQNEYLSNEFIFVVLNVAFIILSLIDISFMVFFLAESVVVSAVGFYALFTFSPRGLRIYLSVITLFMIPIINIITLMIVFIFDLVNNEGN